MKKVAIAIEINNNAGRSIMGGILKYVSAHSQWHVKILSFPETLSAETVRQVRENGIDGIILNHVGDEATADEIRMAPVPVSVVDVNHPLILGRRTKIAFIKSRNDVVGALGARKFLSLGRFRSFVFVTHPDTPAWSEDRKAGYCAELRKHKIAPIVLDGDIIGELMHLPRPIALMAAWDYKAIEVLETCREHGLRVPEDVSVIGVDADPLVCGFTIPSLTSVEPDFERLGYCAAAALDAMMSGHKLRTRNVVRCRPKGLVERASTRFLPPAAALLHHAKEIIERDAVHGLSVQDLARRLGVSQQLLALRFRQFENRSVRETIIDTRLDCVKARLSQPYTDLGSIARNCGFRSANRLAHLFKKRFGLSPGVFARQHSASPEF